MKGETAIPPVSMTGILADKGMKCLVCGYENPDGNRFCSNCGVKLAAPETSDSSESFSGILNDFSARSSEISGHDPEMNGEEQWFYLDDGSSNGPFRRESMLELYRSGFINTKTLVKSDRMLSWVPILESTLGEEIMHIQPEVQPASKKEEPNQYWYYADHSSRFGPFTDQEMLDLLENGRINGSTYIWKEGMSDWTLLRDTPLRAWIRETDHADTAEYDRFSGRDEYAYRNQRPVYRTVPVVRSSIAVNLLLSIVTCGIYYFIWIYHVAQDVNNLAAAQNKPQGPSPALALILSVLSCGLFQLYFYYKDAKVLASLDYPNYRPEDDSLVCLLLALFGLPIISLSLLQGVLNNIADYGS